MSAWLEKISRSFSEDEVVSLAQELIRRPSHWDVPHREKEAMDYLCSFLDKHELAYEKQHITGDLYNVLVTLNGQGNGKRLLFNGHMDTVPPYDMEFPPFEANIVDGYIQGRGAVDMKGPIAAMVTSLLVLKRLALKLKGDVIFAAVVGEEGRSEGTEALVLNNFQADGAIIGEPSNFNYAVAHRGLEWLEIEFFGKRAHSGDLERGVSAISMAARFITALEERYIPLLKNRYNPLMGPSIINFGRIEGGTQPSTVAEYCKLQLDRRYVDTESNEQVIRELEDFIKYMKDTVPGFDASLKVMDSSKMLKLRHVPMVTREDDPLVTTLLKNVELVVGRKPTCTTRRGWTDAGLLNHYLKIPAVICGCGDIAYSHSKNEQVSIEQLVQAVKIYTLTAIDFCSQSR
ncbi:MAG: M20 family metallopeptidase [Bacillota bacterium]